MLRYLQLKWSQRLFTAASYAIKFMRKVLCVQFTWDVLAIVLSAPVLDLVFREKNKQEINFDARRLLHTHKKNRLCPLCPEFNAKTYNSYCNIFFVM